MVRTLDPNDLQGNILRPYGRQGFPKARYIFLHVAEAKAGRAFVEAVRPRVTTAMRWQSRSEYPGEVIVTRPQVTFNIAFNFYGLLALGLPTRTLAGMPPEFIDGMAARATILGDLHHNRSDCWDDIWRRSDGASKVHILVALNAQMQPDGTAVPEFESATQWVLDLCEASGGKVTVLPGHGRDQALYQDCSAILTQAPDGGYVPTAKEHFGFTDGFGDPVFEGQFPAASAARAAIGGGKILPDQTWAPLATGEFLLGYPDEAQEVSLGAMPLEFARNGTFMAYRKLHENVVAFRNYIAETAAVYGRVAGADVAAAREILMAKMVGRWSDGVPLVAAPTYADWQRFQTREAQAREANDKQAIAAIERAYVDFQYRSDPDGLKCPVTAHMRRSNTRDMLDPALRSSDRKTWSGSVLNNRRRILRRGLPYGTAPADAASDDGEHGIIFMAVCASLFRQFEFVQQQWLQYGLDFNVGNDTCPIIGNHGPDAKFVIAGDPTTRTPPFICTRVPQLVEMRGGDYFFIPSMTALRMIGMGVVDPT